jgi:adenosylhomocysteine nucleosidase
MKGNILIIAALRGELRPLVKHSTAKSWRRVESSPGIEVWEYRHPEGCWLAACAGMGTDRAAIAFSEAEKFMPIDAVCSVGWAGALNDTIPAGSVWGASQIVDTRTGERFLPCESVPEWPILATTPRVVNVDEKRRLAATYGAALVDMEAAAVSRIAEGKSIPFYCFKAVSDDANATLPDLNPFIGLDGQMKIISFLLHIAVRPSYWSSLLKLGRHSASGAKNLAESIYDWIDERAYARQATGDYVRSNKG